MPATRTLLAYLLLVSCAPIAAQETAYVIDKLLIGVHQSKNLDSAIIKVLPTGTRLEVWQRDGELAYVEDPDGTKGWVDTAYLTNDQPAALIAAGLRKENAALAAEVEKLKSAAPAPASNPGDGDAGQSAAQVQSLMKENTQLKGKLSNERLRAGELQTQVSALRSEVQQAEQPNDLRIAELERGRDELKQELDHAKNSINTLEARASRSDAEAVLPWVLKEYAVALSITLITLTIVAFGAGIYLMDLVNRRRHGGFRV